MRPTNPPRSRVHWPALEFRRVSAENPVTLCDVYVLVQKAAEPVAS
jgi:hypothetical protein